MPDHQPKSPYFAVLEAIGTEVGSTIAIVGNHLLITRTHILEGVVADIDILGECRGSVLTISSTYTQPRAA